MNYIHFLIRTSTIPITFALMRVFNVLWNLQFYTGKKSYFYLTRNSESREFFVVKAYNSFRNKKWHDVRINLILIADTFRLFSSQYIVWSKRYAQIKIENWYENLIDTSGMSHCHIALRNIFGIKIYTSF